MNLSRRETRRVSGFTLVELLVVIGIIALLISILLPSLNKARVSAQRVQCLANEKQILNAILMYVNDSRGILPGPIAPVVCDPRVVNVQPGQTKSQMDTWNGGTYYSTRQLSYVGLLQRYLGVATWQVWQCPAAKEMWAQPNIGTSTYFGNKQVGFGYMIQGESAASNVDPFAQPPADMKDLSKWHQAGPHIMIFNPAAGGMTGYVNPGEKTDVTQPWVMWAGSPYEHLMIPVPGMTP